MAETLPLFPLGLVLFPDMLVPLHIFEPRYRLLVRRCIDKEESFGVVLTGSADEAGAHPGPHQVGTTARIVGAQPLPDGRSFIVVRGERRFAVESLIHDEEPYLLGRVRYLPEDEGADAHAAAAATVDAFVEYLLSVLTITGETRGEPPGAEIRNGTPRDIAYRIAGGLAIDTAEQQRLLETESVRERLITEARLLDREKELLRDLVVRRRARGEGPVLN
ncbi:MAG: LON peptidase substrate-binding domain-containing protein [Chloroflexota bacterium]|nr:LON peptidase substrate-binding domain-containing protein [Chloroflexota bacterium]